MVFLYKFELAKMAPNSVNTHLKLVGSSPKLSVYEHVHKRKMVRNAILQFLYLQMIMLIVDSEYARYILSLHTAGLCY